MSRVYRVLALMVAGCLAACQAAPAAMPAAPAPRTLTVFAAASLTEAFSKIGAQFEAQHPGVTLVFNFAGSQQLAQQLADGAPADVFASANQEQMDAAVAAGRIAAGSAQPFASNRLVVITPTDNPAGIATLQQLAKPGVKLVLAAAEVPAGQYALDFLAKAAQDTAFTPDYANAVLANVASYEVNVKAVVTKVALGEADAGIIYRSDLSGTHATTLGQLPIPDALNVTAVYPMAAVQDGKQMALAADFVAFVLSPAGQTTLAEYGFTPSAAR